MSQGDAPPSGALVILYLAKLKLLPSFALNRLILIKDFRILLCFNFKVFWTLGKIFH